MIIRHICWVKYWFCPISIFYVICHNIPHTPYACSPVICVTTSHWPPTHPFDVCTPIQSRSKMCNNSQVKRTCGWVMGAPRMSHTHSYARSDWAPQATVMTLVDVYIELNSPHNKNANSRKVLKRWSEFLARDGNRRYSKRSFCLSLVAESWFVECKSNLLPP